MKEGINENTLNTILKTESFEISLKNNIKQKAGVENTLNIQEIINF